MTYGIHVTLDDYQEPYNMARVTQYLDGTVTVTFQHPIDLEPGDTLEFTFNLKIDHGQASVSKIAFSDLVRYHPGR